MMPRIHIRLGDLNPVDLETFPPYLKHLLKLDFAMMIGT